MKISKLTQTHIPPFMTSDSSVSSPMIFFMVPSIPYTYTYLYCLYFPPYPPILKTESFHWFSQKTHSHKTYSWFGSFPRDLKGNGSGAVGVGIVYYTPLGILPASSLLSSPSFTSKAKHSLYCIRTESVASLDGQFLHLRSHKHNVLTLY